MCFMFPLHLLIKTLTVNFVSGLNFVKPNQELKQIPNELYLYMLAIMFKSLHKLKKLCLTVWLMKMFV